jgi:hypothetical protein
VDAPRIAATFYGYLSIRQVTLRMVEKSKDADTSRIIKGLGADGPNPRLKEKLMLFGQFVGD